MFPYMFLPFNVSLHVPKMAAPENQTSFPWSLDSQSKAREGKRGQVSP